MTALRLEPWVIADLAAARDHYEAADPNVGRRFVGALDVLFGRLEAFPRSAPLVAGYEDVRRAVVRGFPSVVFYRRRPGRIDVLRILHAARSQVDRATEGDLEGG